MSKEIHFGIEVDDTNNYVESENEFYSQAHQDLFVLGINNYIQNGTWVDIGCAGPRQHSNTLLLESMNWTGLNFDIKDYRKFWKEHRKTEFIHCDATKINYKGLFEKIFKTNTINYLSLDIDTVSNIVLQNLPFDEYKFNVITIEHDLYAGSHPYRQKGYTDIPLDNDSPFYIKQQQHDILIKNGYVCLAENIFVFQKQIMCPFEDWWVSRDIYNNIKTKFTNVFSDDVLNQLGFVANRNSVLQYKNNCIKNISSYATECLDTATPFLTLKNKPQIIFIKDEWVNIFIKKILPHLFYPFKLITNSIPNENNKELLNNSFLQQWYCLNSKIQHPKIVLLANPEQIRGHLAAFKK